MGQIPCSTERISSYILIHLVCLLLYSFRFYCCQCLSLEHLYINSVFYINSLVCVLFYYTTVSDGQISNLGSVKFQTFQVVLSESDMSFEIIQRFARILRFQIVLHSFHIRLQIESHCVKSAL